MDSETRKAIKEDFEQVVKLETGKSEVALKKELLSFKEDFDDRLNKLENWKNVVMGIVGIIGIATIYQFVDVMSLGKTVKNSDTVINGYVKNAEASITDHASKEIERIDLNSAMLLPVGTVVGWNSPNPPDGGKWLICNGDEYDTTQYPKLQKALASMAPNDTGDEEPRRFSVPDMTGQFVRGARAQERPGTHYDAQVGSHKHYVFGGTQQVESVKIAKDANRDKRVAWAGGSGGDGYYELRASGTDAQPMGTTFENETTGNWPQHTTMFFIIKAR